MDILPLLLLGITTISFIQFALFGTALPAIINDLHIGYDFAGILMAIWTLASIIGVLIVGRSIDRIDITWLIPFIMGIQSILTLLIAFTGNVVTFSVLRTLISLTMPFIWPICAKITSIYLAGLRYGYTTSLYDIGSIIGLALTYILMFFACNWRKATIIASTIGFAYTLIIYIVLRNFTKKYVSIGKISKKNFGNSQNRFRNANIVKMLLTLFLAFFFAMYAWGFIVDWLSTYLLNDLRFSYADLVLYMLLVAILGSVVEVMAGLYSDKTGGLKGKIVVIYIGLAASAITLLLSALLRNPIIRIISVTFSLIAYRIASPSFWAIINEIIPPNFIGRYGSIYNLASRIATIASSIINGYIIKLTNSARYTAVLSASSLIFSIIFYSLIDRQYKNFLS
ncbi:MAG: MFS transporter [Ignisphaera sp.]